MKKFFKRLTLFIMVIGIGVWIYAGSLIGVHTNTKTYLTELKQSLKEQGHRSSVFVVSGKRWPWHNKLLSQFGGAASNSRHLKGEAIDIIVLDVNKDGKANSKDVDIVYQLLNEAIIRDKGGVGTYKNEKGFFDQQMVHLDCRGYRARWHR